MLLLRNSCLLNKPTPRSLVRKSLSSSSYQDLSLLWGSTHREEAQACLNLPRDFALPTKGTTQQFTSFEDYWKFRDWNFNHVQDPKNQVHARNLVTHVLSEPMTAAVALLPLLLSKTETTNCKQSLRLCCIGARAEASLPPQYWNEILLLAHYLAGGTRDLTIDFIGPDVHKRPQHQQTCELTDGSLTLRWLHGGKFHEFMAKQHSDKMTPTQQVMDSYRWDAYVMFNPGIGHPNLAASWKPTLDLLLPSKETATSHGQSISAKPMLLTAHSELDAVRDGNVLKKNYPLLQVDEKNALSYHENPFASRILYQDPLQTMEGGDPHMVRPNHFYCTLMV